MPLSLEDFAAADTDYIAKLNNNNAAIEALVNTLETAVATAVGEGAALMADTFDRNGLVGAASYVLDLENYPGGAAITIGRRPAFDVDLGDQDVSIAWITAGGNQARVTQTGDVVLNAAPITSGLPKTIYVGIPSSGTAQLYEDTSDPDVLYAYSMTWDGFSLTDFKRMASILPGYTLLQQIAGAPRVISVFDNETDWVGDLVAGSELVLPGASDDNEINVDGSMEVIGFFVHAGQAGDDAWSAMESSDPATQMVQVQVVSDAVRWNLEDLEIDAGNVPDVVFAQVDTGEVGDDRFVTEVRRFSLEVVSVGGSVVSARGFTWGLIVRPIHGLAAAKDNATVVLI